MKPPAMACHGPMVRHTAPGATGRGVTKDQTSELGVETSVPGPATSTALRVSDVPRHNGATTVASLCAAWGCTGAGNQL